MNVSELKYKLKGNESFYIREGWLNKGITVIQNSPSVFSDQYAAMDILGVGSKMVKSIKYWMLTSGLVEESRAKTGKRTLTLTNDLGEIIYKYDKYFEDVFTLWIIHYNIVKRLDNCTVWNLFFNHFDVFEFNKKHMESKILDEFNKIYNKGSIIAKSISDDCSVLLKMYSSELDDEFDPEDNLISPFSELGLIEKNKAERGTYRKMKPIFDKLDKLAILYVIVSNMNENKLSNDIDTLATQDNNIGKVFNLDRNMINEYLDQLRQAGYITLNRTAGLDMVYLKNRITPKEIIIEHYKQIERDA